MMRTRGAQLLANIVAGGVDQAEVARACNAAESNVSRWLAGTRKPSQENKSVLKARYQIPLVAWAERELEEAAASPPAERLDIVTKFSVRERAETLQKIADDAVRVLSDATATGDQRRQATERLKGVKVAQGALNALGKITGETKDLTEAQIVKTPAWSRVCTKLLKALAPWPEAVLAVGHTLRAWDQEGR